MNSSRISRIVAPNWCLALATAATLIASFVAAKAAGETAAGSSSGLPIPRFVSLKPDKVNVRGGPTRNHDITWQYTRAGLPVEITAESDNWRRIRDWEGSEGWVYHSLLSGKRTVVVSPWKSGDPRPIYTSATSDSSVAAYLQPGVNGEVSRCHASWRRISGAGYKGWIPENQLWGVYPDEEVD